MRNLVEGEGGSSDYQLRLVRTRSKSGGDTDLGCRCRVKKITYNEVESRCLVK